MWWIIGGLAVFLVGFWLFFHRHPARDTPKEGIISPASGKVVRIVPFSKGQSRIIPKGLLGKVRAMTRDVAERGSIVVIMLTPLDVHYQRAPVTGKVLSVTHVPGRFRNAVHGAREFGGFENERTEILIQTPKGRIKVVQVAGFLARRTKPLVTAGQRITRGQIIGLITFGSQVLFITPHTTIRVREGQKVVDGESVIA